MSVSTNVLPFSFFIFDYLLFLQSSRSTLIPGFLVAAQCGYNVAFTHCVCQKYLRRSLRLAEWSHPRGETGHSLETGEVAFIKTFPHTFSLLC